MNGLIKKVVFAGWNSNNIRTMIMHETNEQRWRENKTKNQNGIIYSQTKSRRCRWWFFILFLYFSFFFFFFSCERDSIEMFYLSNDFFFSSFRFIWSCGGCCYFSGRYRHLLSVFEVTTTIYVSIITKKPFWWETSIMTTHTQSRFPDILHIKWEEFFPKCEIPYETRNHKWII